MTIDAELLRAWPFPALERSYNETDAILYALGLGLGQNPIDPMQLQFVYEDGLRVLPTMSVVLGWLGPWLSQSATGVDYTRVVHGEQHLEVLRPLAAAGALRCESHVVDVVDRGREKGAAISVASELFRIDDGELVAKLSSVLIARGDGGFSQAQSTPSTSRPPSLPPREPDLQFEWRVPPQIALIYRLSGDRNPLHASPEFARRAGFERPILHGLASFGIAGLAAVMALCGGNADCLQEIGMRFSAPVIPGDTLIFEFWTLATGEAVFQARALERDRIVLNNGRIRHSSGSSASQMERNTTHV